MTKKKLSPEEQDAYALGVLKGTEAQKRGNYSAYMCRVTMPYKGTGNNEPLIKQFIRGWKNSSTKTG